MDSIFRNAPPRRQMSPVSVQKHTSLIASIQLQHRLFVCVAEHLTGKTEDRRRLANARHAGDDDVWQVAILCDDLQSFDGFRVADDVVEVDGTIFLDPNYGRKCLCRPILHCAVEESRKRAYQGKS